MSHNSPTAVAFYLPQFHPIPENDAWWGTGFTEWTNVAKAQPLFKGHEQPFLPSDLGFYDLRVPEAREQQANLAKEAGVGAFAYWHYWFGDGRRLLERPLKEVLDSGKPDFPFCLAWANETWSGRWHGLDKKILMEQRYPGKADEAAFFYDSLPYFQDKRYLRREGACVFLVYRPNFLPEPASFLNHWRELGAKEGIKFHFVGIGDAQCIHYGFDAWVANGPSVPMEAQFANKLEKAWYRIFKQRWQKMLFPNQPERYAYARYVQGMLNQPLGAKEYPLVLPNWDNTPRSGKRGVVLQGATPQLYEQYLRKAVNALKERPSDFVFIKSWNEWAEGNVLEPSRTWGKGYIQATAKVLKEQHG